jgi:hypothetical protein
MVIDVARLRVAFVRLLWEHGMVRPELVKHEVNKDGSHTISVTLGKEHVKWVPPKRRVEPRAVRPQPPALKKDG